MKLLYFLLFTGIASVNAFQPANRNALKAAVDACVDGSDSDPGTQNGAECYACLDGTVTSWAETCADGYPAQFISDWDTSLVTNMENIFSNKHKFNQPLYWNTSKVTTFSYMFYKTDFNQPVYFWDTSKVKNFAHMFSYSKFNQDLLEWDVSSLTDTKYMFMKNKEFDKDLSCWGLSSGSIDYMFAYADKMTHTLCWSISGSGTFAGSSGSIDNTCTATGCTSDGDTCSAGSDCVSGSCSTTCQRPATCYTNEHVSGGTCKTCPAGRTRPAGDDTAAGDTVCMCKENEHVSGGTCQSCYNARTRPAGDDPTGADTVCACATTEKYESGSCVACPAGFVSLGGTASECTPIYWQPADRTALKNAINECVDTDTKDGSECYRCMDGTKVDSASDACAVGVPGFISYWDTSKVWDFETLFSSKKKFNQPLYWDTSKVTHIYRTFKNAESFDQDLSCWDISSVTRFDQMFMNTAMTQTLCWDITDTWYMFADSSGSIDRTCTPGCTFNGEACSSNSECTSGLCDTVCKPPNCGENEHASGGSCVACPAGDINDAGDDPKLGDTFCTTPPSVCSACTVPLDMKAVSVGTKVVCEDTSVHCSGEWVKYGGGCYHPTCVDTQSCCGPCLANQHVSSGKCEACPAGKHKAAGDKPPTNTECWADGSCGGVTCIEANTQACTTHTCECKTGFGGLLCDKDISTSGIQEMLRQSRKKALPTKEDLIERQNTIKTFARDTLKHKLKQGKSVKEAIAETKIRIEPSDLPQRSQMIVQLLNKAPVVAVAPKNKDSEDTCDQGVNTPGCSMVDLNDDDDELTILSTDPEPGSWSVLSSGGSITSKQTRVSEFVYEMQCWDNGWGAKQTIDTTNGAEMFICNGNVIMVASQAGVCTPTVCGNGNCTVDGTSYVCLCDAGWSGDNCDQPSAQSQCYEFDCSNYGGHVSLDHCGGVCDASMCCTYATKSEFDAACNALTTSSEYVANKCCHRDVCI